MESSSILLVVEANSVLLWVKVVFHPYIPYFIDTFQARLLKDGMKE